MAWARYINLLFFSYVFIFSACTPTQQSFRVGVFDLDKSEILFQINIYKNVFPGIKEEKALRRYLNDMKKASLIERLSINPHLQKRSEHFFKRTNSPKKLKEIKSMFDESDYDFKQDFVLLRSSDEILYEYFKNNDNLQGALALQIKKRLLDIVSRKAKFSSLKQSSLVKYKILEIDRDSKQEAIAVGDAVKKPNIFERIYGTTVNSWETEILPELFDGVIGPGDIVFKDLPTGWRVIRILKHNKQKTRYFIEQITYEKTLFSDWLESEIIKIHQDKISLEDLS